MENLEQIKEVATSVGGSDWSVLSDAVEDADFKSLLTNQESNLLSQITGNPNSIRNLRDPLSEIVAKYIAWHVYKNTNIRSLKKKTNELEKQVKTSEDELRTVRDTAKHIGGAEVLVTYAKSFATTAKKHKDDSDQQLKYYIISLVGFTAIVGLVFFFSIADLQYFRKIIADDIKGLPLNTAFFALKAVLLLFAFQITQFFRKNYGAEKHLQEVYQHRSDTLRSLHAVYNAITNTTEKDKILSAGVLFAYERGETGYITTKEGAGSGDGVIEGIFSRMFR